MSVQTTTIEIGGETLELEIGRFAEQANAAVTARYGDTVVFASVVMGRVNESLGYFPMFVEYQEKLYAGGRIKGSRWVKRDGRPSDDAILKARIIDRTIRPLFPKGFVNEIQIVVTVLSADGDNDADMPALAAVSTALAASNIPWAGPVAGVRIGLNQDGKFMVNPTFEEREESSMDLIVSGSEGSIAMVEAGAEEVSEAKMLEAFQVAQDEITKMCKTINAFAKKVAKEKVDFTPVVVDKQLKSEVYKEIKGDLKNMVQAMATLQPSGKEDMVAALSDKMEQYTPTQISDAVSELLKEEARRQSLEDGVRPDGRKFDEIRQLSSEIDILPRTHGSAIFKRGATQALTITTLGAPSLNQLIENMEGEHSKRYIHHYSMPPYSVGETGRIGWPSRREVGHGALAERALMPVIPSEEDFPYTIQVVSELMSSNGSTSMASVCGSTMSLMDAGVPIKKPVAGIAMGLLIDGDKHVILSDIQGLEDHTGDMDFKVAGTRDGITAMQMDIKVKGISFKVVKEALEQALKGRIHILEHMLTTISEPNAELSEYAPKIETITIDAERIGEIIGPGGKVIRSIIEETGAEIDIQEDGRVFITSVDSSAIQAAKETIEGILKQVEPGEVYKGKVSRIENFGAFVDILPNKSGLVHVSQLSSGYVKDPNDVVSLGDEVEVRVSEIDNMGRINLTMLSEEEEAARKSERQQRGGGGDRNRRAGGGSRNRGGRQSYRP